MIEDYRFFEVADPFGELWQVKFLWQQNAISIRHADAVDVKFIISSGEARQEKVIALAHPDLLALSAKAGRPVADSWVSRLAAVHLRRMIETWEDMEKTIVSPSLAELETHNAALEQRASALR
ncbi:MAG TPA: hypothetical protein VN428_25755 [Bryobacteraceae bacterium]|nr:hypothetical protein [Bryobacteraceae bacterium]